MSLLCIYSSCRQRLISFKLTKNILYNVQERGRDGRGRNPLHKFTNQFDRFWCFFLLPLSLCVYFPYVLSLFATFVLSLTSPMPRHCFGTLKCLLSAIKNKIKRKRRIYFGNAIIEEAKHTFVYTTPHTYIYIYPFIHSSRFPSTGDRI